MDMDTASLNRLWEALKAEDEDAAHDLAVAVECRRLLVGAGLSTGSVERLIAKARLRLTVERSRS